MKVQIATGTRQRETWKVTEVLLRRRNGGCKVRAVNPHTGRTNTLWVWEDALR